MNFNRNALILAGIHWICQGNLLHLEKPAKYFTRKSFQILMEIHWFRLGSPLNLKWGSPNIYLENPWRLNRKFQDFQRKSTDFHRKSINPQIPGPRSQEFFLTRDLQKSEKLKFLFLFADLDKETHKKSNFCQFVRIQIWFVWDIFKLGIQFF